MKISVNVLRPRKTENQIILLGLASAGIENQKKKYKLWQYKQRDSTHSTPFNPEKYFKKKKQKSERKKIKCSRQRRRHGTRVSSGSLQPGDTWPPSCLLTFSTDLTDAWVNDDDEDQSLGGGWRWWGCWLRRSIKFQSAMQNTVGKSVGDSFLRYSCDQRPITCLLLKMI